MSSMAASKKAALDCAAAMVGDSRGTPCINGSE